MPWRDNEPTHEFEGKIEFVSSKSRLVEDTFTGKRYWLPKKCTVDFNPCDAEGNLLFVVTGWWWKKAQAGDFDVEERKPTQD